MDNGRITLRLRVNGEDRFAVVPVHHTLLEVLREELGLTGTKHGCELGECGTCAVLVDGKPVLSCLALTLELEGKDIKTVEGMADGAKLHPLQEAFADLSAAQCGYCTPGFLLTAQALLEEKRKPSRDQIKEALAGNLCRCTGYIKIYESDELAAARMRGEKAEPNRESIYGKPYGGGVRIIVALLWLAILLTSAVMWRDEGFLAAFKLLGMACMGFVAGMFLAHIRYARRSAP